MEPTCTVCACRVHSVYMTLGCCTAESRDADSLSYTLSIPALSAGPKHQTRKLTQTANCVLHHTEMPRTEGFCRGSVDVILCAKCLHDFKRRMQTIRTCVRSKQLLISSIEVTKLRAKRGFFKSWPVHMLMASISRMCGNYLYHGGKHVHVYSYLKTKRRLLYLKTQSVRRSKHFSSRL